MNKKIAATILAVATAVLPLSMKAQSIVVGQDFEGETFPPQGWTVSDRDGDGRSWISYGGSGVDQVNSSSKRLAVSFTRDPDTYNITYGSQDNWLISPAFTVDHVYHTVEFIYAAQDTENSEPMQVLVSETGIEEDDFEKLDSIVVDNGYGDNVVMNSYSRSLRDYVGKTIRIAVRHKAAYTYGLSVDNFYIMNQKGPKQPTGFSVKAASEGTNAATLQWTNPSKAGNGDDLTGVEIVVYRDGVAIANLIEGIIPGEQTTWIDNNVTAGTHSYTIAAKGPDGEGLKLNSRSVYVGEDIPAPAKYPIAMARDGKIVITWTAPTAGANKGYINLDSLTYTIRRTAGDETVVVGSGIQGTTFTDEAAPVGVQCVYSVHAVNGAGESVPDELTAAIVYDETTTDIVVGEATERDNSMSRLPIALNDRYSVSQTIYYPADFQFVNGTINKLVYKVYRGTNGASSIPVQIYMNETSDSVLTNSWHSMTGAVKVFDGMLDFQQGPRDVEFTLDTPFEYNGGNLVVTFIKTDSPNGAYSDRFYSVRTSVYNRSFITDVSNPVDINNLPVASYSAKLSNEVPSTRFIMTPKGVGSLSGKVKDAATEAPIAGAKVTVIGVDGMIAETDAQGCYAFKYLPVSVSQVQVSAVGYADSTVDVAIAEGVANTRDISLMELDNYTLTGRVTCADTRLPAIGAVISLSGYEEVTVTADENGSFSIPSVYSGKDYELTIEYPIYDVVKLAVNNESTSAIAIEPVELVRSLIPAYAVGADVATDGSHVTVTWNDPLSRDVETGWKSIGNVSEQYSTTSDYYTYNFNIGHRFTAEKIASMKLVGTSVTEIKGYLASAQGSFTARVWRVDGDNRVVIAEKAVDAADVTADGSWVTVVLDEPVELRSGKDYIVGFNCNNPSSGCIGTARSENLVSGENNVKWAENPAEYSTNTYAPICIMAKCEVPGTSVKVAPNNDVPQAAYNVYRSTADGWEKLTASPINEFSYNDASWSTIVSGDYRYAVTAVYQNGESAKAFSDVLQRSNDYDVSVVAFVSPIKSVELQTSVIVTVKVANFGEKPVSGFPVNFSIDGVQKLTAIVEPTLNKGESLDVTLGTVDIPEGLLSMMASTGLESDQVPANDVCELTLPNLANIEMMGFRWDAYGNSGVMRIQTNNPEGARFVKEVTPNDALIIAGECVDNHFYGYTATWYGSVQEFVELAPDTWTIERHIENLDDYILDMTYDYKNQIMFGLRPDGYDVQLVKIDLASGVAEAVGSLGMTMRTLACDLDGTLYGISDNGGFYEINSATAVPTLIGATGVDNVAYLQSMAFDHNSKRLFWALTNATVDGAFYEIDPATGVARKLGNVLFNGDTASEIVALYSNFKYEQDSVEDILLPEGSLSVGSDRAGRIVVKAPQAVTVELFNAQGAKVSEFVAPAGHSVTSVDVVSGIYVVRVRANGAEATAKVRL